MKMYNMKLEKIMGLVDVELSTEYQYRGKNEKSKVKELLERLEETDMYVDDHNGGKREEKLQGWAILRNGYVCPILKDTYFCLNPLYIDEEDNKVHLSTMSVAGTIISKDSSMKDAIEKYNDDLLRTEKALQERFRPEEEFKQEDYGKVIIAYRMK